MKISSLFRKFSGTGTFGTVPLAVQILCGIIINILLQVFEFLIRLHSAEAPIDEEVYPYVRTLLHFDTREFLNVLALVSCNAASPNSINGEISLSFTLD